MADDRPPAGAVELRPCIQPGCTHLAEVVDRRVLESTDGPVEHVRIRCLGGHAFFCPTFALDDAA